MKYMIDASGIINSFKNHFFIAIQAECCVYLFQVKQIMEEAVTRKFVHADSSHIISFCSKWLICSSVILSLKLTEWEDY